MRTFAILLVLVALILALVIATTPAHADFIQCGPLGECIGTDEADDIDGTSGFDEIRGKGGNDNVNGFGSGDNLYGGNGSDVVVGGGGDDALFGRDGADELRAASDDSGGDFVDCGDGDDEAWVDPGDTPSFNCEVVHTVD